MEPAKSIILMLGGPTKIARALSITPGAVCRWAMPVGKGSGGIVPSHHIPTLVRMAREQHKELTPNSFFEGHI